MLRKLLVIKEKWLPDEPPPRRLSAIEVLTQAANAAIGTFSAALPLFYADMGALVERSGELRLLAQPAPVPSAPVGVSKEGGKEVVTPPPPPAPPADGGA